jgi:6-phosphogluconolactonase (cycloisomerase 2 family)
MVVRFVVSNTSGITQPSPIPDLDDSQQDNMLRFFQVSVTDSSGNPVHITRYEAELQKPVTAILSAISRKAKPIPPDGTQEVDYDISSPFDLSNASKYTIVVSRIYYKPIVSQDGKSIVAMIKCVLGPSNASFTVTEPTDEYYRAEPIIRQLSTQPIPRVKYIYALQSQEALRPGGLSPTHAGRVIMYQSSDSGEMSSALFPGVSCGVAPQSFAFTKDGANAYVAAKDGTVWQYSVANDGELQPLSPPSVKLGSSASSIIVSQDGKHVYITDSVGCWICSCDRKSNGLLISATERKISVGGGANSISESPNGRFLYCLESNDIAQFTVESNGTLAEISPPWVYSGKGANCIVVCHSGKYLYISNGQDNTVSGFRIGPDGAVARLAGADASIARFPISLELNPDDSRLYVASDWPSALTEFSIGSDGSLEERAESGQLSCRNAAQALIDPDQKFACVTSLVDPICTTVPLPLNPNNLTLTDTLQYSFGYGSSYFILRSNPVSFNWHTLANGAVLAVFLQKQEFFPEEPIILSLLIQQAKHSSKFIEPVTINVLDSQGNEVPRTSYGRHRFGQKGSVEPSFTAACGNHKANADYFTLDRMFDMTVPGIYHIKVSVGKTFEQQNDVRVALPTSSFS